MAAADVLYEVMTLMVKKGPLSKMVVDGDGDGDEGEGEGEGEGEEEKRGTERVGG